MKKIAVITSGGDAPGMNAAVRGVVRSALHRGVEVLGFLHGYRGIISEETLPLASTSVGGIISQGGTTLRTARCPEFREKAGREQAIQVLQENNVDGLVVIGGDGSLTGARALVEEFGFPVMGIPGSIDNDIAGTDFSIGFDTAVNTALQAIDKIRDTAYSHERVFVIEVMGRNNGFIALEVALSGGAEAVLIPEVPFSLLEICDNLRNARQRGKRSSIIVVAEGAARAGDVKSFVQKNTGFEARESVLGHMQRGGSPTSFDRVLALRLGAFAANRLISGFSGEMVGVDGGKLVHHPLSYILSTERTIDPDKLLLVDMMAN
ncbi:MAG: 6-phosphofructokinase [Armatimonadetes bacterium]|nr:6-phosphofructokinase [Armatimonadota bacterium]MBS1710941.1 6-phosphofructokinase [Armatimonadota bacterium]MBX3108613.1 6-phosphofructokinase [Fimbriimonadaceae bacterium]